MVVDKHQLVHESVATIGAMKLSARNQLRGTVTAIEEGAVNGLVTIKLDGAEQEVTASITNRSIEELGLEVGKPAIAVIKSSEVMVGIDD
ncbi:putative molybdenum-pterin-binding protein 2 [Corynebacterium renale]|nr:putative molybdenum-pterin-binding protein 2 [Corynebacterium renale]STC95724.1 putative molybdenum-pterin-binding protein 2 [Corynebacterium renale]